MTSLILCCRNHTCRTDLPEYKRSEHLQEVTAEQNTHETSKHETASCLHLTLLPSSCMKYGFLFSWHVKASTDDIWFTIGVLRH